MNGDLLNSASKRKLQIDPTREIPIKSTNQYDMIVFCHLRWDFVYQRPQHLISRFSKDYKILFVEEPFPHSNGSSNFNIEEINSNLHVLKPNVQNIHEIGNLLKQNLSQSEFAVGWFYSAAFVDVLEDLKFENIVYDCMDELTLFKGASEKLIQQEKDLLEKANVVYTGGKSLYESKMKKHDNVHCFPSSIDNDHFSKAINQFKNRPADMENIPEPIVGYYGVIDERINLELLEKTAKKSPETSFVMIGPICKINESDLPRAENIYYLGMKSYEELPHYLQFFDIAMMPFALNDATKFISPTKTLEYMSAMKPIISTRIHDVERDYAHCLELIDDADDFIKAIKNYNKDFKHDYQEILNKTSWDNTVEQMNLLIRETV